ncbi:hypothetical protein ACE6H2_023936 [Prunus campanulata]
MRHVLRFYTEEHQNITLHGVWMRNRRALLGCPGAAADPIGDVVRTLRCLLSHSPLFMSARAKLEYRLYIVRRLFESSNRVWRHLVANKFRLWWTRCYAGRPGHRRIWMWELGNYTSYNFIFSGHNWCPVAFLICQRNAEEHNP